MLHGRLVRAQLPSARILTIDTSAAAALPGVRAIFTADDVPWNEVSDEASGLGLDPVPQPVLAAGRVRYQGEPVAVVAAEDPETAEEAAELVVIDYDETPGVFDPEAALEDGAPPCTRTATGSSSGASPSATWMRPWRRRPGRRRHLPDPARRPRVPGARGRRGWFDADGVLTLRVSTQVIEHVRQIARIMRLPQSRVRVIGDVHGRRLRREGGHDRRALPGAAGMAYPPARAHGVVPAGVDRGPAEAASVRHALPHRCDAGRRHRRPGHPHRRRCRRVSAAPRA